MDDFTERFRRGLRLIFRRYQWEFNSASIIPRIRFKFKEFDPSLYFCCSWLLPQWGLLTFRILVFLYLLAMTGWDIYHYYSIDDLQFWAVYVTNWTYTIVILYYLTGIIITKKSYSHNINMKRLQIQRRRPCVEMHREVISTQEESPNATDSSSAYESCDQDHQYNCPEIPRVASSYPIMDVNNMKKKITNGPYMEDIDLENQKLNASISNSSVQSVSTSHESPVNSSRNKEINIAINEESAPNICTYNDSTNDIAFNTELINTTNKGLDVYHSAQRSGYLSSSSSSTRDHSSDSHSAKSVKKKVKIRSRSTNVFVRICEYLKRNEFKVIRTPDDEHPILADPLDNLSELSNSNNFRNNNLVQIPFRYRLIWVLYSISFPATYIVAIVYWSMSIVAPTGIDGFSYLTFNKHGIVAFCITLDTYFTTIPYFLAHVLFPFMFCVTYLVFTIIYYFLRLPNPQDHRDLGFVYSAINFANPLVSAPCSIAVFILVFIVVTVIWCFVGFNRNHLVDPLPNQQRHPISKNIHTQISIEN
ncbi:hypothetical protein cand_037660 [Cryptosporidium andersoni]|uniref:Uncharacterized protein n=1 Tax=Cryptosporidium andersoni TaxID=117008 RepID=A0A1J4MUY5_9CRYT|nr:hypothetical protein cand_037660 [Cryptosporidium andersoni]